MKIQLSLEVWVDVFAPITRWKLAGRLNEIGSRSFATIVMFWLHEYGQIRLTRLSFGGDYGHHKMTDAEMPANIKDFHSIEIWFGLSNIYSKTDQIKMDSGIGEFCAMTKWRKNKTHPIDDLVKKYRLIMISLGAQDDYIDRSLMITFFTNLRPLLSNVNLWCNIDRFRFDWFDKSNQVPDFLNILLPLIDSIDSIHFYIEQCFDLVHEKFADKFFSAKIISINYEIMEDQKVLKKAIIEQPNQQERDNVDAEQNAENEENNDVEEKTENEEIEHEDENAINDGNDEEDDDEDAQQYEMPILERRMAILRKWLLFNANENDGIIGNNDGNEANFVNDQPRILYVEKIYIQDCRIEIDNISKEFLQSTKPTGFIVCFIASYSDVEERRDCEVIRHVNQKTNEILSTKCYPIGEHYYRDVDRRSYSCAVFLHSHPIMANGEEHEGNMLLINKMQEKITVDDWDRSIEDKFVYSTNRHINLYRKGRMAFDDSCWCGRVDCEQCGWSARMELLEKEEIEKKKKEEMEDEEERDEEEEAEMEEEAVTEMPMFRPKKRKNKKIKKTVRLRPKRKNKKKRIISRSEEMNFLWQKELRIEAFERRMKSRIKGKEKLNIKKAMAQMTINGGIGEWWKKDNKKQKNMAEIFD